MAVQIGEVYEGTVVKLLKYGAIVRIADGTSGLVHISELADTFVYDVADFVREGDQIKVKVTAEKEGGRYEMSAKQVEPLTAMEGTPSAQGAMRPRASRPVPQDFEERLDSFMKASNQRLAELRRGREARRRGGRK